MLSPGARLGPYEIIGKIGAGGMGEVYRARDGRLKREVAIKLLPAGLARDADALRRLEQEARAIAALNHPNLLAIYDTGATAEDAPYLVCELLEGETLRERLAAGALPVREALDYGAQIAHGLAAAHAKGIVHRDLKPGNLFCTQDGRIKILDFGLAKATAAAAAEDMTAANTAEPGTKAGVVLGTLGYMSPEQARGQAADARSDIFSLGAVLYEMLSGQRAFQRDTAADTISAILHEEPAELTLANQALASPLQRIVRHCLEKQPARRFESASDLAFALESVGEGRSTTALEAAAPAPRGHRRLWFALGGSLGLMGAVLVTWRLASVSTPQVQFQRLTFKQATLENARFLPGGQGIIGTGTFSGDATPRAFTVRQDSAGLDFLNQPFAKVLAVAESGVVAVQMRPRRIINYEVAGTLGLMPISGGAPRPLLEDIEEATFAPGATAGNEQAALAIVRYHPDSRDTTLEFPAGKILYQTSGWLSNPRFSRDGKLLAVLDHRTPGDDAGGVLLVDLNGRQVLRGPDFVSTQGLAWSPGGGEAWYTASAGGSDRSLYALTLSGHNRRMLQTTSDLYLDDVLPSGQVLMTSNNTRSVTSLGTAREARARDVTVLDWATRAPVSADGEHILVGDESFFPYTTYWEDSAGSDPVKLGNGEPLDLSDDGQWALSLVLPQAGASEQLWLLPTGAGSAQQVTHGDTIWVTAAFIPGRRELVGAGNAPGRARRTYLIDWNGAEHPLTPEGVLGIWPTPDGQQILTLNAGGNLAMYPVAGGPPVPVKFKLAAGAGPLRMAGDGASFFVQQPLPNGDVQVERVRLGDGVAQPMFTVSLHGQAGTGALRLTGISADGKTYTYAYHSELSTLYAVTGLK